MSLLVICGTLTRNVKKDCLLTHSMSMTSILFVIGRVAHNQFKRNYPTKKKLFLIFLLQFWNWNQIFNILNKNIICIAHVFPKLWLQKTLLDKCLKYPVPENSSRVNMLRRWKHCWNLHESTFMIIFHHSDKDWVTKCLC